VLRNLQKLWIALGDEQCLPKRDASSNHSWPELPKYRKGKKQRALLGRRPLCAPSQFTLDQFKEISALG
jgi:hypothetical protein